MKGSKELHIAIKAVCPIAGVCIPKPDTPKDKWRIDFKEEATEEQRAAAMAIVEAFDPNEDPKAEMQGTHDVIV